jgi:hypothetical protein
MWYVGYLLLNKEAIRFKAQEDYPNDFSEFDEYNDLLLVEKKLNDFINNNLITAYELNLFNLYFDYPTNIIVQKSGVKNEDTIDKNFLGICERIGYALGGMFTDDGYSEYVKNKYKLSDEQCLEVKKYIQSALKYKLAHNIYRGN